MTTKHSARRDDGPAADEPVGSGRSPGRSSSALDITSTGLSFGEGEALRVEDVMQVLHLSRNTVYKMAREGTLPSYRVGRQVRFRYEDVRARLVQTAPDPERPVSPAEVSKAGSVDGPTLADLPEELPTWARGSVVLGGQSMAGDVLANYLSALGVKVLRSHANDYMSLARMYLGTCHAAVVGLWSEVDGTYNMPYVRRFLPGVPTMAFRLFKTRVGLTVPSRNPRGFDTWHDLLAPGVRVANRERGASTRVLLDEKLKYLEASGDSIEGYDKPVASELAQALMVARGMADVAVTTEKPARQMKGLTFLPLQDEVNDLVVLRTPQTAPFIKAVRSLLRTDAFRSEFDATLFDTRLMGEVVYEC